MMTLEALKKLREEAWSSYKRVQQEIGLLEAEIARLEGVAKGWEDRHEVLDRLAEQMEADK